MSRYAKNYLRKTLLPLLVLLTACGQPPVVPLEDQSIIRTKKTEYIAGSGDTLYSIAFLSGLDYKQVAVWNNIDEPYIIRRGQKINLIKPERLQQNSVNTTGTIEPLKTETTIARIEPAITEITRPELSVQAAPAPEIIHSDTTAIAKFDNSWQWPISASNIVNYRRSGQNSGLDIISHFGVDVKASASGKVVYAGNGLKGYGNLIIIKHNDYFLSAYAHNRSIYVKEGDLISQGQKIAEVGSSEANQAKLHFEIRKSGTPVSPLKLLPKKVG